MLQLDNLQFTHFIVAEEDGVIFASARRQGKVSNFLINIDGKWVKEQIYAHFEKVPSDIATIIRSRAESCYGRVPIYKTSTINLG